MKFMKFMCAGVFVLSSAIATAATQMTKSADGVDIAYEIHGQGSPALVFVHGWSCDRTYWDAQVKHFSKNHQIIAIDLAGHGESGFNRKDYALQAFGEDVSAVLNAENLNGAILIGHSMGGPVIFEAQRLNPNRVKALLAIDGLSDPDMTFTAEEKQKYIQPLRDDFKTGMKTFVKMLFRADADPTVMDKISNDMADAPPAVAISAIENLMSFDQIKALQAAHVPLRMINADLTATNLTNIRKYKPDAELAVLAKTGHFLMIEKPDLFNLTVEDAIQDLKN